MYLNSSNKHKVYKSKTTWLVMKKKSEARQIIAKDGLTIRYWMDQDRTRENVVLLHTGSSSNHTSLETLERLLQQAGCATILMDHRGVGYSDSPTKPEFYTQDRLSDDVKRIVEQEGLKRPILLGHSIGFMAITDYALSSQNAKGIVGICASPNFAKTSKLPVFLATVLRRIDYSASVINSIKHLLKGGARGDMPDFSTAEGKSDFPGAWLVLNDLPFSGIRKNNTAGADIGVYDVTGQLKKLTIPLNLVYGTEDLMVPKEAGDYIKSITTAPCTVNVVNGGHSIPYTNPRAIFHAIESSLRA